MARRIPIVDDPLLAADGSVGGPRTLGDRDRDRDRVRVTHPHHHVRPPAEGGRAEATARQHRVTAAAR
ncbi:hypothetical protein [Rhodococcus sp. JS3073]|uniref:hypothetical protein n=1 Tax=Rhodococcus sp. JS3073 TaxID=3002901 RepID=UPI0022864617|nr:hypothetical protein [Rhodococcus sp. JS3073]WAM14597.1 hypothetical protein OYT95_35195 [Rhodococcus sp. JS3073]